jgi:hypothetical protein
LLGLSSDGKVQAAPENSVLEHNARFKHTSLLLGLSAEAKVPCVGQTL